MKTKRDLIKNAIENRMISFLKEMGFKQSPYPEKNSQQIRTMFPFGIFRRKKGKNLQLIEIQMDMKSPQFRLNFSEISPRGWHWRHVSIPQDKCGANCSSETCFLYGNKADGWFSGPIFKMFYDDIKWGSIPVEKAIKFFPEVELWFENRISGPHIKVLKRGLP